MSFIDFTKSGKRILPAFGVVLLAAVTTYGYTVVMRGGKRIEIPAQFAVTRSTVTYEAFPGINVTLQMSAIDVPATEKANNELPGSLLQRAALGTAQTGAIPGAKSSPVQTIHTLTDRDLEPFKRARRESEAAYERRRIELGLPSLEESRRQRERESELFEQELSERKAREQEVEDYWRTRANDLRAEMVETDAQIDFVRSRLSELGPGWFSQSYTVVTPFFGRRQIPGRAGFAAGRSNGQAPGNPASSSPRFGPGRARSFPRSAVLVAPFLSGDLSQQRVELFAWLDQLVANSVGLQARFRLLEEEARRAGVPPGWLRP